MSNRKITTPPDGKTARIPSDLVDTPTVAQTNDTMRNRRMLVALLNVATFLALLVAAQKIGAAGGWTFVDAVMMAAFTIATPWAVLGFWNAVIGLWLLHGSGRDSETPNDQVAPFAKAGDVETPLCVKTAILMTLRNEDPDRAFARMLAVAQSVEATGHANAYRYFLLSDTDDPEIAAREETLTARWRAQMGTRAPILYRRRTTNTGFKAGNLHDFCARWGENFDLMLPLDADSLMSGDEIIRLTRIMQAHPQIGIVQGLVVGAPTNRAFPRIFQFGMRLGMRTYTMGQAWWTGDCGPFWGHNAILRVKPFASHCVIPKLPGSPPLGGYVLSHDQIEAVMMRRAGFEVRVLPFEGGSWEDNPPTLLEYMKRDARWCQGNLQYIKLLGMKDLHIVSRFQMLWAISMFLAIPAWTVMIALTPFAALEAQSVTDYPVGLAITVYLAYLALHLAPKLAGHVDTILTKGAVERLGGPLRYFASATLEMLFTFLHGAAGAIQTTIFMIGLVFGKSTTWRRQVRDATGLTLRSAISNLWPQTLVGIIICTSLALISWPTLLWSLPLTAGYLLAVPFAVATANPRFGHLLERTGLCQSPDEHDMPQPLCTLRNPQAFDNRHREPIQARRPVQLQKV